MNSKIERIVNDIMVILKREEISFAEAEQILFYLKRDIATSAKIKN